MKFGVGIGDILLTKMIFDTNPEIKRDFIIHKSIIEDYRDGSEEYLAFVTKLSKTLMGEESVRVVDKHHQDIRLFDNRKYRIEEKHADLAPYLNLNSPMKEPYIAFHTKARFASEEDTQHVKNKELPEFKNFLKNFKSQKKIVIFGEQRLPPSAHKGHQFTFYDELLVLRDNNDVLDLTMEELYTSPNWEQFKKDMSYINGADLNIGLGYGGNAVSCCAFSRKNCFFTSKIEHRFLEWFPKYTYNTLESFLEEIKKEEKEN